MKTGLTYKHIRCLDLTVRIEKILWESPVRSLVNAWLVSPTGYLYWPEPVMLIIVDKERSNWKLV